MKVYSQKVPHVPKVVQLIYCIFPYVRPRTENCINKVSQILITLQIEDYCRTLPVIFLTFTLLWPFLLQPTITTWCCWLSWIICISILHQNWVSRPSPMDPSLSIKSIISHKCFLTNMRGHNPSVLKISIYSIYLLVL